MPKRVPRCTPPAWHCYVVPTMQRFCLATVLVAVTQFGSPWIGRAAADEITVFPDSFVLHGKAARQRLVVTIDTSGTVKDATRDARFHCNAPGVAVVSAE